MAPNQLGIAYSLGQLGLTKDEKRAAQLYELSAAQGHAAAQHNIGTSYYHGRGVKMDKKKALLFFKQAAGQGYASAQCNCGLMYYHGEGVDRDVEEGLRFLEQGAAQGHQQSQDALATLRGFLRR